MSTSSLRHAVAALTIGILSLALVSCGGSSNLDGVYHGIAGSPITITIKSGKATVQVANESKTLDYKVEGNKLTILDPQGGQYSFHHQ
jgi:hypothetical protein